MGEPLPLAAIQEAILEYMRGVTDAVLFGAQAVNAYVDEPRMTQDVDILSLRAQEFAEALRKHLSTRFHAAIRVREIAGGRGYRLFQIQKSGNRHLADIRAISALPPIEKLGDVQVAAPAELVASKVIALVGRKGRPKSFSDRRDVAELLLKFPELKVENGAVRDRLDAAGAEGPGMAAWKALVAEEIVPEAGDEGF